MTKPVLFITVILVFVAPTAAQTHFYLEDAFKRSAKIPDSLLPSLRSEIKSRCRDDAAFAPYSRLRKSLLIIVLP